MTGPSAGVNRKETRAHFLCGHVPGEAWGTPDKERSGFCHLWLINPPELLPTSAQLLV